MADTIPMRPSSSSTGTDGALSRRHMWLAVVLATVSAFSGFGVAFVVLGHADRGPPSDSSSLAPQVATTAALRANLKEEVQQAPPTPLIFPDQEGAKAFNAEMRKDISGIPKCTANSKNAQKFREGFAPYCKKFDTTVNGKHPDGKPVCWDQKTQNSNAIQTSCAGLQDAKQGSPSSPNCMGPLAQLIGTWVGTYGKVYSAVPNYTPLGQIPNDLAGPVAGSHFLPIPGQPTSDQSGIKHQTYTEKIVFAPILGGVKNRGYKDADQINAECQANQILQGVSYKLFIYQTSPDDSNGEFGNLLHEEVGQWMYNSFPASGNGEVKDWTVARMSVVPHGVTFVATGNNTWFEGPQDGKAGTEALLKEQNDLDMSIRVAPQDCVPGDTYDTNGAQWGQKGQFGHGDEFKGSEGDFTEMNPLLTTQTEKVKVKSYVTLSVQQKGDLSQTPFIKTQVKNSDFTSKMWIQNIVDEDGNEQQRIQYQQRVTWTFMQQFRCLKCHGGEPQAPVMGSDNKPFNTKNKCWTNCDNLNQKWGKFNQNLPLTDEAQRYVTETKPFSLPTFAEKPLTDSDWTLNQIPASQQRRCYNCVPNHDDEQPADAFDMDSNYQGGNDTRIPIDYERMTLQAEFRGKTCKEDPLAHWPHMQLNTLTKVSDDYADVGPLREFTKKLASFNFNQFQSGEHRSEVKTPQ